MASLLKSSSKRLIRTEADALDGVIEAIKQYEWSLRHASPTNLEDLWNTPTCGPPSPKAEERISDKLCESIRQYFRDHAVTADREVQVFRRNVPTKLGGAPGSEVDVLVRIPSAGTLEGDPIAIPIEVKRSDNREAKTGLREQLVDRYMTQLGTSYGVFIVVWLTAPTPSKNHGPVWPSIDEARESLKQQVEAIESNIRMHVSVMVVDASLV